MIRFVGRVALSLERTPAQVVDDALKQLRPRAIRAVEQHRQELERDARRTAEDEFYAIRYVALLEDRQRLAPKDEPTIRPELAVLERHAIQAHIFPAEYGTGKPLRLVR